MATVIQIHPLLRMRSSLSARWIGSQFQLAHSPQAAFSRISTMKFSTLTLLFLSTVASVSAQRQQRLVKTTQLVTEPTPEAATPVQGIIDDEDDNDDDIGTLTSVSVKAKVSGVDMTELNAEHETFIEDAMAFAYNKINKHSDKFSISSHLVGMKQEDEDADNSMLRKSRYVSKIITSLDYSNGYGCHLCGTCGRKCWSVLMESNHYFILIFFCYCRFRKRRR